MVNKNITLNAWENNCEFAMAVQGEVDSRFLTITLIDNNGPINLKDKEVNFLAKKPDGTIVFNHMEIENPEEGTAVLELTSQMSAVPGVLEGCEVHVTAENGETLIVGKINILIKPSMGEAVEESFSEFTAWQNVLSDIINLKQHAENKNNPHNITTSQIGAATTDVATNYSSGLMSAEDKIKLDTVETGANVNVQSDWSQTTTDADDYIKNKPTIPTKVTDLTGVLPLSQGGTGATTAADAQKNLQWYNSATQLGLSDGCSTSAIYDAMPRFSIFSMSVSGATQISDVPAEWGHMTIIKSRDRKLILFNQSLSGGSNGANFYFGEHRNNAVTWYKILTTNPNSVVPIENGGTGAKTAAAALLALGGASAIDVGDVSSLQTTSKTIVGAINELYAMVNNT